MVSFGRMEDVLGEPFVENLLKFACAVRLATTWVFFWQFLWCVDGAKTMWWEFDSFGGNSSYQVSVFQQRKTGECWL